METAGITRRGAVKALVGATAGVVLGCRESSAPLVAYRPGELRSRPARPGIVGPVGRTTIEIAGSKVVTYVPASVDRTRPTALLLVLHGAFGNPEPLVDGHVAGADSHGVIIVAPYASLGTWDAIRDAGNFTVDADLLDATLAWVFERWTIDPGRIALSGFSDGATYTLGIGRANGDLFKRLIAYAPGFLLDITPVGRPSVLIAHGTRDAVVTVENSRGFFVPWLRQQGYPVDYREWDGLHAVPLAVVNEVLQSLGNP